MQDTIKLQGIFHLKVFENGNLIETYEDKNVIVTVGRAQLAHLLGGDVTNRSITKIGFGENSTAAVAGDTSLSLSAFVKSVGTVSYPTSTSVKFAYTLLTSEGNGLAITEFGLICNDNVLFSRKQRSAINKTSSISLVGDWTINL